MKFSFRNIGVIQEADIELKGLTIITGLNDIGKSVLSKSVFSIIKTLNRANELAVEERNSALQNVLQQIISIYRQSVKLSSIQSNDTNNMLINNFNKIINLVREDTPQSIEAAQLLNADFRNFVMEGIDTNLTSSPSRNSFKILKDLFDSAARLIIHEPMNEEKYKTFFNDVVIRSIFQGQFNSKLDKPKPATVSVIEGDTDLLKLQVDKEKTTHFNVLNDVFYNEVTLIESPYVVQLNDFTNLALAYLPYHIKNVRQSNLPYHIRDISLKVRTGFGSMTSELNEVFLKLSTAIEGNVHYDAQENTIVFEKDNGVKIKVNNIASGVKSFGLLQMYLSSGYANSRSLLIIDEPEVHLHLKWQLIYAELICSLAALGIPIIVSTHSPFFLEALTVYVKKQKIDELVTIYNGIKDKDNGTIFTEVSKDDLSVIFEHLTEPMVTLQMLTE